MRALLPLVRERRTSERVVWRQQKRTIIQVLNVVARTKPHQVLCQVQYQVICHQHHQAPYKVIYQVIQKNRRKNRKIVKNKFKRESKMCVVKDNNK